MDSSGSEYEDPPASDVTQAPDDLCQDCGKNAGEWYCSACTQTYCDHCWEKRRGHQKENSHSANHAKVRFKNHVQYEAILHPPWSDAERKDLHEADLSSLWLAISAGSSQADVDRTDFPRFNQLVFEHRQQHGVSTCYPRLASFVGATGAGKSTIIRILLEKPWLADTKFSTEVPIVGKSNSTKPTSGDIHLYGDGAPEKDDLERPIFYADCEGFDGGAAAPSGSLAHHKSQLEKIGDNTKTKNAASSAENWLRFLTSRGHKKPLNMPSHRSRKAKIPTRDDVVRKVFPRLLYNFSDVIVFVVKEHRTLSKSILGILDWASTSATSALNRATLPHLIILTNNAEQMKDWSPETAKESFFKEHNSDVDTDPNISRRRRRLADCGIDARTLEELLEVYYASVDVLPIPNGHMRSQLSTQVEKLSSMIQARSRQSQKEKFKANMLLQSQDQEYFFQLAFDHFFDNIDSNKPFDFLAKMLELHTIPHGISDCISTLLWAIFRAVKLEHNPRTSNRVRLASKVLKLAAPSVASIIALSVARSSRRIPGKLIDVFQSGVHVHGNNIMEGETYYEHVRKAFQRLCERTKCEFVRRDGVACAISGRFHMNHTHQDKDAEYIGKGAFESDFVDYLDQHWATAIVDALTDLDYDVEKSMIAGDRSPTHSNAIVLTCGHAICEECIRAMVCVKTLRWDDEERLVSIKECPLHAEVERLEHRTDIQLKPSYAGHGGRLKLKNKVFVTATKRQDGLRPTIFTNYIRAVEVDPNGTDLSEYDYEMANVDPMELAPWEAARATSAAPTYFPSYSRQHSPAYLDGGLRHNNPAWIAREEISKIWPRLSGTHPDVLLSIGNGYSHNAPEQSKEPRPKKGFFRNLMRRIPAFEAIGTLKSLLEHNMDSEYAWNHEFSPLVNEYPDRYFRLNPWHEGELPKLDDLDSIPNLEDMAQKYISQNKPLIKEIAHRLIVTSFYFEPDKPPEEREDEWAFKGHIGCRFFSGSKDLMQFLDIIEVHLGVFRFKMKETKTYIGHVFDRASLDDMREFKIFTVENVSFVVPKDAETVTILLESETKRLTPSPISGCPWHVRTSDGSPWWGVNPC
ncbi:hypothetical protein CC86DRAFT_416800 [Ophiobolus disseminans]|uniref:B box-type domain-containing protein n=1 Tax=Ophiobolus disseminans TaxID=1469910 RepID=A0A6A7A2I5_9PLEO|nr:hypothetical protein CC86DRAFT_416800 [Ophiobolus disseminans]